jgi:hypothetical protein
VIVRELRGPEAPLALRLLLEERAPSHGSNGWVTALLDQAKSAFPSRMRGAGSGRCGA